MERIATFPDPKLRDRIAWPTGDFDRLAIDAAELLETKFNIHHTTVQMERDPCEQATGAHRLG